MYMIGFERKGSFGELGSKFIEGENSSDCGEASLLFL